ncbi:MAG: sulfoxide reductase heme-binding subunit YedZ [Deltaproteobacteria bacterium]|nr:sulfoxide reductase heme-binding subunit YedZ [Deltaproteobacteria bacterium]
MVARAASRSRAQAVSRIVVPIIALLPLLGLAIGFYRDELGADPIEKITHETGDWGLRFLLLTLSVTPLRKFSGWNWLAPHRRSLGLVCFSYACLHFATYLVFDLGFDFAFLGEDILERPYITVGFSTFTILSALALTSNKRAIRKLKKRWVTLHRLIYLAGVGAVVHFLWLVKADLREPLIYAFILAALLATRVPWRRITRR